MKVYAAVLAACLMPSLAAAELSEIAVSDLVEELSAMADPGGANLNKGRDFPQTIPYWTDKHIKDRGTPPYTPPPDWEYNTNAGPVEGKINVHIVPHTHDDTGWQVSRAPLAGRSPCLF
jgi:hypothetical protein